MKKHESEVLGRTGGGPLFPVADASITVYVRNEDGTNGAKAVLYSDNGVTEKGNPVTSDRAGEYWYYAADGRYNEVISGAGIDTRTISDVLLEDPADGVPANVQAELDALEAGKASLAQLAAPAGSSLVGMKRAAMATAVETTLALWHAASWVNLKADFGAVGDGVTDDTAAVIAAKSALSLGVIGGSARNRCLYAPAGVYLVSAQIPLTDVNFSLVGDGPAQTVFMGGHATGHVFNISALGDVTLEGFSVDANATRIAGAASDASCGIYGDSGTGTLYRVLMRNVYVMNQPGHGVAAQNPELWQFDRCFSNLNKKTGFYLRGRDLSGISNSFYCTRARLNGEYGYYLENIEESTLIHAQGLENALDQCNIASGWGITLIEPDFEAFSTVTSGTSLVGVRLSGHGHKLIGGRFYALNTAIRLSSADNCIVMNPRIDGKAGVAMATGVFLDSASDNNEIRVYTGTNVTAMVSNSAGGTKNSIYEDGKITLAGLALAQSNETYAASFTPDLSKGSNFALTLTGNITINAPTNMRQGQLILFTFTQDATGGRTVTWNGAWKQTWVDTGNTASKRATIAFLSLGTGTAQQMAAQGPYVS